MQPTKYIGITDFTDHHQVRDMLGVMRRAYKEKRTHATRKLMVGVMMSHKTLRGLESSWSAVFPPKEKIAEIFSFDSAFNCLHYADYDGQTEWADLYDAIIYGGIGIRALQLDMVWPDPDIILPAVHSSRKQLEVILQVGRKAFEKVENDPKELTLKLLEYEGAITHVLLDKSGGEGKAMDTTGLLPFMERIQEKLPWLAIGVAGGLGPGRMDLLGDLPARFPNLNIDAQGQLRPSGSARNPIDWNMAAQYLREAVLKLPF